MTRHTPGMLSAQASMLSLRQQPMAFTTPSSAADQDRSQTFESTNMEERAGVSDPICDACVSGVSKPIMDAYPRRWHPAEGLQRCVLCRLAESKPEAFTKPFCDFLQENPTIFHTVDYFKTKLNNQGFKEVRALPYPHTSQQY